MTAPLASFIHNTRFTDLPPEVVAMARTCILDLLGVACAGSRTALSEIARGFADPDIRRLSEATVLERSEGYDQRFPAERWAHVAFRLVDGRTAISEPAVARGNPENPLSAEELTAKYRALACPVLGEYRAALVEARILGLGDADADAGSLVDDLIAPAQVKRLSRGPTC